MKIFQKVFHIVTSQLDSAVACIALFIALFLTIYLAMIAKQPVYAVGCALACLSCATYLLFRNRFLAISLTETNVNIGNHLFTILSIIFFILFSYVLISFYLRTDVYIRPISFFVAITIMAIIVAIQILCCHPKGFHVWFVLFEIMIIALILRWSPVFMYPGVVGVDPWTHQRITADLLAFGHIQPDALNYFKMPSYHIFTGMTSLITGLEYKYAVMCSVNLLQVICDVLFIFLLGKAVFNTKVGLMAGLLLGVANYHVQFGYWTIPNTMGLTIVLIMVYMLFKIRADFHLRGTSLWIVLALTLILTHSVCAMCMCILLFAFLGRIYGIFQIIS